MKTLTMRELNRRTAGILDAVERGEMFELRRHGKVVGYITKAPPVPQAKPDWKAHFARFKNRSSKQDAALLADFEEDRRRLRLREEDLANPK